MKRKHAISAAKVAGYHNDTREFTRLIVESMVRRETLNEAWREGVRAKSAGVPCDHCQRMRREIGP